jgi:hypothetical protein
MEVLQQTVKRRLPGEFQKMLPAADMDNFPSDLLKDHSSNLFRHDGFSFPQLSVLKPDRGRMGEKEPSTSIMVPHLLVQPRKRKGKQGTQILPRDELR